MAETTAAATMSVSAGALLILQWVNDHWMFLAFPLTFLFVVYKYAVMGTGTPERSNSSSSNNKALLVDEIVLWSWMALPMYAMHQFEEHGYDLYGRRYQFISYFNEGFPKEMGVQLTPTLITAINLVCVHFQYAVYAWRGETTRQPLYGALINALSAVNAGGAHLLVSVLNGGQYNPGCAQSLFMLPFSLYAIRKYYQWTGRNKLLLMLCFVYGGPYAHGLGLMLPLKLLSQGYFWGGIEGQSTLGVWAYLAWTTAFIFVFPILVVPFAPTESTIAAMDTEEKPRKD